jgi:AcrR family transcriptional regulator
MNLGFRLLGRGRSVRVDARRNRECIVATALGLFAERGAAVSMEEIACGAGLGVGTLYRHFPDRQALLEEVGVDALRRVVAFSAEATASGSSAWQMLLDVIAGCAGLPLALIKSLSGENPEHPELPALEREVKALHTRIIEQAQREGSLRDDLRPDEVIDLLNVVICRPGARADDQLTVVMLDGLAGGKTLIRRGSVD